MILKHPFSAVWNQYPLASTPKMTIVHNMPAISSFLISQLNDPVALHHPALVLNKEIPDADALMYSSPECRGIILFHATVSSIVRIKPWAH